MNDLFDAVEADRALKAKHRAEQRLLRHDAPPLAAAPIAVVAVLRTGWSHAAALAGKPARWILNALFTEVGAL
jgi:hypothetical protein